LLEEFSYTIEHRPGRSMAHIDALSRYPLPQCMLIDASKDGLLAQMETAQQENVDVNRIIDLAEARKIDGYVARDGIFSREVDNDLRMLYPFH